LENLINNVNDAFLITKEKAENEQDNDKKAMLNKMLENVKNALEKITIEERKNNSRDAKNALLEVSDDVLSTWLDRLKGKSVTDNSIFNDLPRHYENEFHKDMAALNVNTEKK
jgi:cysteinyl-tRNA synthetase